MKLDHDAFRSGGVRPRARGVAVLALGLAGGALLGLALRAAEATGSSTANATG